MFFLLHLFSSISILQLLCLPLSLSPTYRSIVTTSYLLFFKSSSLLSISLFSSQSFLLPSPSFFFKLFLSISIPLSYLSLTLSYIVLPSLSANVMSLPSYLPCSSFSLPLALSIFLSHCPSSSAVLQFCLLFLFGLFSLPSTVAPQQLGECNFNLLNTAFFLIMQRRFEAYSHTHTHSRIHCTFFSLLPINHLNQFPPVATFRFLSKFLAVPRTKLSIARQKAWQIELT